MTAQTPEILLYRGQKLKLCDQPLYYYLQRLPKSRRPKFIYTSSACWRGYIGTWEIRDGYLRLVALEGTMETEDGYCDASLERAFPWVKKSLKAKWYTETAHCPEGRLISYAHAGYASIYERDRIFNFENGMLDSEYLVLNPPLPLIYLITSDGSRICVEALNSTEKDEIEDPLKGEELSNVHKVWGRPLESDSISW